MFVASLFSCIIGTLIPGSIYRTQNIKFHSPVITGDVVTAIVDVKRLKCVKNALENSNEQAATLMICGTTIWKEKNADKEKIVCVSGEASVLLPAVDVFSNE